MPWTSPPVLESGTVDATLTGPVVIESGTVDVQNTAGGSLATQSVQTLQASGQGAPSNVSVPVTDTARALLVLVRAQSNGPGLSITAELVGAQSGFYCTPALGLAIPLVETNSITGTAYYSGVVAIPIFPGIDSDYDLTLYMSGGTAPALNDWWAIEDSSVIGEAGTATIAGLVGGSGIPRALAVDGGGGLELATASAGETTSIAAGAAPPYTSPAIGAGQTVKGISLGLCLASVTTPGGVHVQDVATGDLLFYTQPHNPGDRYVDLSPGSGGFYSASGLVIAQASGSMSGTLSIGAIW